jgi:toxin FitB
MFLVDTNVVSEMRKAERGNPGVVSWATGTHPRLMFISVISLYELEIGVLRAERSDQKKGAMLRAWLEAGPKPTFANRILDVDLEVSVLAAGLHVPDPAPLRDSLIGATAIAHGLTVVTRDVRDFNRFPDLEVLNPWT